MDLSLLPPEIQEAHRAFPGHLAECRDLDGLMRLKGAFVGRDGSHARGLLKDFRRKVTKFHTFRVPQHHSALHGPFELSNVSGPGVIP